MSNENYILIPRDIEDASNIIEKVYDQMCLLLLLQDRHELIPKVVFEKREICDLLDNSLLPDVFSTEEIELLALYFDEQKAEMLEMLNFKNSCMPFPVLNDKDFYKYQEVAKDLHSSKKWLIQLIDLFTYFTEDGFYIKADRIFPEDFVYQSTFRIKYLISFNSIEIRDNHKNDLLSNNIYTLANLLNHFYLRDTESYQAKLYKKKWFRKIEERLIEPILYNKDLSSAYLNFREVKKDLETEEKKFYSQKDMINKKRSMEQIAVFLDVANITTAMYSNIMKIEIDFDKLLSKIYGNRMKNICERRAVMFLPVYEQGEVFKEDKYELIFSIKDYLEDFGFLVELVENASASAKTVKDDGNIFDVDDIKLINIMEASMNNIDAALLMSGDAHFVEIARKYKEAGKEIKVLSSSEESTSYELISEFDHYFIYEYYDCLKFLSV